MPSWSIHLAVAKKVNKKLKLNKDLFYYGNLIPDVDKATTISRYQAHFYDNNSFPNCPKENMINIDNFLNTYKNELDNHLILGYYSHLLTDNYFNNIVYSKCWVQDKDKNIIGVRFKNNKIKYIDIEDKKSFKKKYKHKDFELYGKYLYQDKLVDIPKNKDIVISNINKLIPNFLDEQLVNNRFNYLQKSFSSFNKLSILEKIFKHQYSLFTKEKLDEIFNNCIVYIIDEINKLGVYKYE